jgi:hypothetical protein
VSTPHLAVRHNIDPGAFLQRDSFVDRAILDALEFRRRERARLPLATGLLQEGGPQERSDHFRTIEN